VEFEMMDVRQRSWLPVRIGDGEHCEW
jgi:hypothetical protein